MPAVDSNRDAATLRTPCSQYTNTGLSLPGNTAGADATRSTGSSQAPGMCPSIAYSFGVRTSSTVMSSPSINERASS